MLVFGKVAYICELPVILNHNIIKNLKMKHLFYLFFLFSTLSYSQVNNKLDEKNGIKNFKFGDSKSKFGNDLRKIFENMYEYNGTETSLFLWSWEHTYLNFTNDKLYLVQIYFRDNNTNFDKYDNIRQNLETLFGKSTTVDYDVMQKGGVLSYNEWEGKNVKLDIRRYSTNSEMQRPCPDCNITLIIRSKKLETQKLDDDF